MYKRVKPNHDSMLTFLLVILFSILASFSNNLDNFIQFKIIDVEVSGARDFDTNSNAFDLLFVYFNRAINVVSKQFL